LLATLLIMLAAPVLRVTLTSIRPPTLFLVFDGTDSMAIHDQWTDEQRGALLSAVGANAAASPSPDSVPKSRAEFLRALIERESAADNVFTQLQQANGARLEAFVFDGHATTSHLRRLTGDSNSKELPRRRWSEQITTTGQVSALGAVLNDLRAQSGTANLAGVVLFSDFAHNSGPSPIGEATLSPSRAVGVPIHTVGVGAIETMDLAVELQTDLKMKKAERSSILAKVRQTGLNDRPAQVKLVAHPLSGGESTVRGQEIVIGEARLTLTSAVETAEFSFTPQESGLFEFVATVEPLDGESVQENNIAKRQVAFREGGLSPRQTRGDGWLSYVPRFFRPASKRIERLVSGNIDAEAIRILSSGRGVLGGHAAVGDHVSLCRDGQGIRRQPRRRARRDFRTTIRAPRTAGNSTGRFVAGGRRSECSHAR
jgi:hypothetical protein